MHVLTDLVDSLREVAVQPLLLERISPAERRGKVVRNFGVELEFHAEEDTDDIVHTMHEYFQDQIDADPKLAKAFARGGESHDFSDVGEYTGSSGVGRGWEVKIDDTANLGSSDYNELSEDGYDLARDMASAWDDYLDQFKEEAQEHWVEDQQDQWKAREGHFFDEAFDEWLDDWRENHPDPDKIDDMDEDDLKEKFAEQADMPDFEDHYDFDSYDAELVDGIFENWLESYAMRQDGIENLNARYLADEWEQATTNQWWSNYMESGDIEISPEYRGSSSYGIEVVSPRIAMTDKSMKKVAQIMNRVLNMAEGAQAHENAGLHVHVSIPQGAETIHKLRLLSYAAEKSDEMESMAGRSYRHYAEDIHGRIEQVNAAAKRGEIEKMEDLISRLRSMPRTGAINMTNVQRGTIEFRIGSSELVEGSYEPLYEWLKWIHEAVNYALADDWVYPGEVEEQDDDDDATLEKSMSVRWTLLGNGRIQIQKRTDEGNWEMIKVGDVGRSFARSGARHRYLRATNASPVLGSIMGEQNAAKIRRAIRKLPPAERARMNRQFQKFEHWIDSEEAPPVSVRREFGELLNRLGITTSQGEPIIQPARPPSPSRSDRIGSKGDIGRGDIFDRPRREADVEDERIRRARARRSKKNLAETIGNLF